MGRAGLKACQPRWMQHREANNPDVNNPYRKVKGKVAQLSLTLCDFMGCTFHISRPDYWSG